MVSLGALNQVDLSRLDCWGLVFLRFGLDLAGRLCESETMSGRAQGSEGWRP